MLIANSSKVTMSSPRSYYSRYEDVDDGDYYTEEEEYFYEEPSISPAKSTVSPRPSSSRDFMSAFNSYQEETRPTSPPKSKSPSPVARRRGDVVTLKVGNWERDLELERYPHSFLSDLYYDESMGGDKSFIESSFDFIPKEWEAYKTLREWEDRGYDIFKRDEILMRQNNRLPVIRYSDVSATIGVLGTSGKEWLLYVLIDESTPPIERYRLNSARGEMIRKLGISTPLGTVMEDVESNVISQLELRYSEEDVDHQVEHARNSLAGMVHNALLAQIGDGTSQTLFTSIMIWGKENNKVMGVGLVEEGKGTILSGPNWAYITWRDLLIAYDLLKLDILTLPYEAMVRAGLIPFQSTIAMDKLVVNDFALPLAYWSSMESHEDDASPFALGLGGLTRGGKVGSYEDTIETFINDQVIFGIASFSKGRANGLTIPSLYMGPTVEYMKAHLGLLALIKIYRVMENYLNATGDHHTKLFLDRARSSVSPYLRKVYTRAQVFKMAEDDKKGMLLVRLPERLNDVAFAKKHGLARK